MGDITPEPLEKEINDFEYTNLEGGSTRLKGAGQNANWCEEMLELWPLLES